MAKWYVNEKEVANIEFACVVEDECVLVNISFYKEFSNITMKELEDSEIRFENTILKNCHFSNIYNMLRIHQNDGSESFFIQGVIIKFSEVIKEEDHSGQIYNAYTDTWSWL